MKKMINKYLYHSNKARRELVFAPVKIKQANLLVKYLKPKHLAKRFMLQNVNTEHCTRGSWSPWYPCYHSLIIYSKDVKLIVVHGPHTAQFDLINNIKIINK